MTDVIYFLITPFAACLILAISHAYLGIHVVKRGVIFVDLALAQIAALGATIAFLSGHELGGNTAYIYSLLFTFIGAAIFAFTRIRNERVPQEAIIGIVYAVSAAAAILVLDRAPQGAEHIKNLLIGNILTVTTGDVIKIFILYFILGIFHWIFYKKFILISLDARHAASKGLSVRFWDFLFYVSFGIVVTNSVRIAGVLLVFSYLIVPAVCAILFTDKISKIMGLAWLVGILASILGLYFSFSLDLPTGAAIVCTFGLLLIFFGLGKAIKKEKVETAKSI